MKDLAKKLELIKKLVDLNLHTEALMEVAVFFELKLEHEQLLAIDTMHRIRNNMSKNLIAVRKDVRDDMISKIQSTYGKNIASEVAKII